MEVGPPPWARPGDAPANTGLRAKTERQPCMMMTKPVGVAQMGGMAVTEKWPSVAVFKLCGCQAWRSGQEREGAKRDVGRASGMPKTGKRPSVTLSELGGVAKTREAEAGGRCGCRRLHCFPTTVAPCPILPSYHHTQHTPPPFLPFPFFMKGKQGQVGQGMGHRRGPHGGKYHSAHR